VPFPPVHFVMFLYTLRVFWFSYDIINYTDTYR
jgi:hypothetical protein